MNKTEIEISSIEIALSCTYKLRNYIVPSKELFESAINGELLNFLCRLPLTVKEVEWYKTKIEQYIDKHNKPVATFKAQDTEHNKRIAYNSVGVTYKGKHYSSIAQLAEEFGISRATLANRISKGWDIDRAVNEAPHKCGRNVYGKKV